MATHNNEAGVKNKKSLRSVKRTITLTHRKRTDAGSDGLIPVRNDSLGDSKFTIWSNSDKSIYPVEPKDDNFSRAKSIRYRTQGAYRPYDTLTSLDKLDEIPTFINCPWCHMCTWTEVRKALHGLALNHRALNVFCVPVGAWLVGARHDLHHHCSGCGECVAVQVASAYGPRPWQPATVLLPPVSREPTPPPLPPRRPGRMVVYELASDIHGSVLSQSRAEAEGSTAALEMDAGDFSGIKVRKPTSA